MRRLEGKTALVTGAGRGIGKAIAESFAREGARVLATGRGAEGALEGELEWQQLDVSREEDWKRVVSHAQTRFGGVDVLVNRLFPDEGVVRAGASVQR